MKKLIKTLALILVMATLTGCSGNLVDCKQNLDKAAKIAGFSFPLKIDSFNVKSKKNLIEISYNIDAKRKITIRKSDGMGQEEDRYGIIDVSGISEEYPINETIQIFSEVWMNLKKDRGRIYVANFSAESGYYSISCPQGMDLYEIRRIFLAIAEVETASKKHIP